jgi:hypothetical protein
MATERDDSDTDLPATPDLINTALLPVVEHIFAVTVDGSAARAAAVNEVLAVAERIRAALAKPPTLQ